MFVFFFSLKGILKNKWSILYLLLSLSEDPRKQSNKVGEDAFLLLRNRKCVSLILDVFKNHYPDLSNTSRLFS